MKNYDLCFIGCGNMAKAIIRGLQKNQPSLKLAATDVNASAVESVGVDFLPDAAAAVKQARYVLMSVKPFHAADVFQCVKSDVTADTVIISIMAGFKIGAIAAALPTVKKIVRVMPNLAAQQLAAMSALTFTPDVTDGEKAFAVALFDSVGKTALVEEPQLDAVTAVSGSGTAYVYEFIQHLINGGIQCGLDEKVAKTLVLQTLTGAVKMVEASTTPIQPMIDAVCSKGGTTIEAIKTLRARGFGETVEAAVKACYDRSVEMGK